jgi:hypothetical protein
MSKQRYYFTSKFIICYSCYIVLLVNGIVIISLIIYVFLNFLSLNKYETNKAMLRVFSITAKANVLFSNISLNNIGTQKYGGSTYIIIGVCGLQPHHRRGQFNFTKTKTFFLNMFLNILC